MHFANYAALAMLFVHYLNSKFGTLFFCWGWIVLKFWAKMSLVFL